MTENAWLIKKMVLLFTQALEMTYANGCAIFRHLDVSLCINFPYQTYIIFWNVFQKVFVFIQTAAYLENLLLLSLLFFQRKTILFPFLRFQILVNDVKDVCSKYQKLKYPMYLKTLYFCNHYAHITF